MSRLRVRSTFNTRRYYFDPSRGERTERVSPKVVVGFTIISLTRALHDDRFTTSGQRRINQRDWNPKRDVKALSSSGRDRRFLRRSHKYQPPVNPPHHDRLPFRPQFSVLPSRLILQIAVAFHHRIDALTRAPSIP